MNAFDWVIVASMPFLVLTLRLYIDNRRLKSLMSNSRVTNCYIQVRPGDPTPFATQDYVVRLHNYAIVPLEDYQREPGADDDKESGDE